MSTSSKAILQEPMGQPQCSSTSLAGHLPHCLMQASRGAQHIVARYMQAQPEQLPLLPTIIRTIGHSVAILRTHPVTSQVLGLSHENERNTSLALARAE